MSQSSANSSLPSTIHVIVMALTAGLILWIDALPVRLALSVFLGLLLVGGLEAVHQATHGNLFGQQWANKWVGTSIALLLLLNFVRYRAFHAYHHAHTATRNDPERDLYLDGDARSLRSLILAPIGFLGFARTVQRSRYVAARLRVSAVHNSLLLGMFIIAMCSLTVFFPVDMVLVYWGPLALFAWLDYLLNQAEHYGMSELPAGADPAQATNNLLLPQPLAILFLYRNLHRVHHIAPKTLWHRTEAVFRTQGDPGMPFWPFFKRYMAEGPRLWGVR